MVPSLPLSVARERYLLPTMAEFTSSSVAFFTFVSSADLSAEILPWTCSMDAASVPGRDEKRVMLTVSALSSLMRSTLF